MVRIRRWNAFRLLRISILFTGFFRLLACFLGYGIIGTRIMCVDLSLLKLASLRRLGLALMIVSLTRKLRRKNLKRKSLRLLQRLQVVNENFYPKDSSISLPTELFIEWHRYFELHETSDPFKLYHVHKYQWVTNKFRNVYFPWQSEIHRRTLPLVFVLRHKTVQLDFQVQYHQKQQKMQEHT